MKLTTKIIFGEMGKVYLQSYGKRKYISKKLTENGDNYGFNQTDFLGYFHYFSLIFRIFFQDEYCSKLENDSYLIYKT